MHYIRSFDTSESVQRALDSGEYEQIYVARIEDVREFDYNTLRTRKADGGGPGSLNWPSLLLKLIPQEEGGLDGGDADGKYVNPFRKAQQVVVNGAIADLDDIDNKEY